MYVPIEGNDPFLFIHIDIPINIRAHHGVGEIIDVHVNCRVVELISWIFNTLK